MRTLLAIGLVAVLLATSAGGAADPAPAWKLPEADGKKWAKRVREAISRDGWTVEAKGNDIEVRRDKAVAMVQVFPNMELFSKPVPDGERKVRYVLRFAPKLSADDYDKLAMVNEESSREYYRLHRAVDLPHKFDDFIATTPAEKERVRAFREAVAKLPRHTLPDLYTPDHSIFYLHSWDDSFPADEKIGAECQDVENRLLRFFGMYNAAAAAGGRGVGRYLPDPR